MRKYEFYKELFFIPMLNFIYKLYDYFTSTRIKYYSASPEFSLSKAHTSDACFDLQSNADFIVRSDSEELISTGIYLDLPKNWEAQIRSRSGLAKNHGIFVLNSPGTIDSGYKGELKVIIRNNRLVDFPIKKGERIAQIKFEKVPKVRLINLKEQINSLSDRGAKGFGSSGK